MKKNQLYTVSKWNKNLFDIGGPLPNVDWGDSVQRRMAPVITQGMINTFSMGNNNYAANFGKGPLFKNNSIFTNNSGPSLYQTDPSDFFGLGDTKGTNSKGSGENGGSFSWKPTTMQTIGMAAGALGSVKTGDPRGLWDTLDPVYHIAGGRESGAGNAMSSAGVGLTQAGLQSGNPWLALAGAGLKVVGGLTNAAWGIKTDKEKLGAVNADIARNKNFVSNASSLDDIVNPAATTDATSVYKGRWFSGGKARKKNRDLAETQQYYGDFANRSVENNVDNIMHNQTNSLLANYSAFGGPIDTGDMGAIEYGFMSDYLARKKEEANIKNKMAGITPMPAFMPNSFAIGGDLQTNGADFSDGLTIIGAGGLHETNPYEGIQLGTDGNGTPNLVEENETVYNDYVFSNRILADAATKQLFKLPKKKDITYADISKRLEKEIAERPNDPISKSSFEKQMQMLEEQQERQKQEMEAERAREAFEALSPEEKVAVLQQYNRQQEAMAQQALQQQAVGNGQIMQQLSPEEAIAAQQMADGSNPNLGVQPQMNCFGGKIKKFEGGGDLESSDWYKGLTPYYQWAAKTFGIKDEDAMYDVPSSFLDDMENVYNLYQVGDNQKTNFDALHSASSFSDDIYNPIKGMNMQKKTFNDITPDQWMNVYNNYMKDYNVFSKQYPTIPYGSRMDDVYRKQWDTTYEGYTGNSYADGGLLVRTKDYKANKFAVGGSKAKKVARKYNKEWFINQAKALGMITPDAKDIEGFNFDADDPTSNLANFNNLYRKYQREEALNAYRRGQRQSKRNELFGYKGLYSYSDDHSRIYRARVNDSDRVGWINSDYTGAYDDNNNLKGFITQEQYDALTPEEKEAYKRIGEKAGDKMYDYNGKVIRDIYNGNEDSILDAYNYDEGFKWNDTDALSLQYPAYMNRSDLSYLRYLPALGGAFGLAYNVLTPSDYSRATGIQDIGNITPMRVSPNYNPIYLTYRPMDVLAEHNRQNASSRAAERTILNSGAPQGVQVAGILANGYNSQLANGLLFRQGLEYNNTQEERRAAHNSGENRILSQLDMQAQLANQRAALEAAQQGARYKALGYQMMDDIDARKNTSINANLTNMLQSLGNIGEEAYDEDRLRWLEDTGVLKSDYWNRKNIAKKGGRLNKKKGGLC